MQTIKCILLVLAAYLTFFSSFATAAKVDPKMKKCTPISQLNSSYTPESLVVGMNSCITKQDYERAAELFLMLRLYGIFDASRIDDPSIKSSFSMMLHKIVAKQSEKVQTKMGNAYGAQFEDQAKHQQLCNTLRQLGRPSYYPEYLIVHGMRAINRAMQNSSGEKEEPIINTQLDTEDNWQNILVESLRCPIVAQ